jgi:hypothetical protein
MQFEGKTYVSVTWNEGELINPVTPGTKFPVTSMCGDIMFVNQGTTDATINNMPLPAGASITFGANANELNVGKFWVICQEPVGALGVYVFRKSYK